MCGIAGWVTWAEAPDPHVIERMIGAMIHRGPDHQAVVALPGIALGHARLSIIDLDPASHQPMVVDGNWIVFNGEIYNYRQLRAELVQSGAVFRTVSDTEVILHAYRRWGIDCLERLNGMFAFAIWDVERRRLFMARDRAGEKPLHYMVLPHGGVVFASELKALRLHPANVDRVNPRAIGHYLSLNYILGSECIIDGVRKLPPAHAIVFEQGRDAQPFEYWDLARHFETKRNFANENAAAEEARSLLDDAVKLRLVSDVPLGAFLSGGIDSGSIVAAMAAIAGAGNTHTFSIGFPEKSYSELPEAERLARTLGVNHRSEIVTPDLATDMPRVARSLDEPFADTSALALDLLSKFARQFVTVCLSGDGGDEIFGGYETYQANRLHRLLGWMPNGAISLARTAARRAIPVSFNKISLDFKLHRFLTGLTYPYERAHFSWREIHAPADCMRLVRADVRDGVAQGDPFDEFVRHFARVAHCHFLDQAMYVDAKTFMVDCVLVKVDRATMAHSLEARAPFLDHRLMERAASMPASLKIKGMRTKHLLKQSQKDRLGREVIFRRKRGFNAPINHWLSGRLREMAFEATTSGAMNDWFDRREVETLWRQHIDGVRDNGYQLFGLTCLGLWLEGAGTKSKLPSPPLAVTGTPHVAATSA